jgi:predicted P-loop ATPase
LPLWDGQTDFIGLMADTVTTTSQDLWRVCFKKWLVASVASVLDEKTINHTAIILSGPQGIGKTTWMLNLCPPELNDYIFSGTINPNNKDTLIHLAECMFINMDELENMNRSEIGAFKEIITKTVIRIRRAYGHHIEAFSRRASFMGSVNSGQFLTDSTGSRRFLCFEIESIDYQNQVNLRMVYSQAYDLFQQGFKFYFDKEEIQAVSQSNEQFQINTAEEELLVTYFQPIPLAEATTFLSAAQILTRINERAHANLSTTAGAVMHLGRALRKFGFEKRKTNGIFVWALQEKSTIAS